MTEQDIKEDSKKDVLNVGKKDNKRDRIVKVIFISGLLAAIAAALVFLFLKGIGIPCIFNLTTGLLCPGCGITRMFMALFAGDFAAAWEYNPAAMIILPILLIILIKMAFGYIRSGKTEVSRAEEVILILMAAGLAVFGIFRNII
ncbi:MAG: DUF2752 domain-containing protein [Lachnospiraceae bacterium]